MTSDSLSKQCIAIQCIVYKYLSVECMTILSWKPKKKKYIIIWLYTIYEVTSLEDIFNIVLEVPTNVIMQQKEKKMIQIRKEVKWSSLADIINCIENSNEINKKANK